MSHTPGPWNMMDVGTSLYISGPLPDINGGMYVAHVSLAFLEAYGPDPQAVRERREADARLIAAAPELLDALKGWAAACELHGADSQEFLDARYRGYAAIAKAEGRS